jgi:hypothetical protein
MNLYIAGIFTANFYKGSTAYDKLNNHEQMALDSVDNYLESYHYIHKDAFRDRIRESGRKVFLDSGAFSAFSLGVDVNLPAYCQWIHHNSDLIRYENNDMMASVLDGIGDPLKTYQNQLAMEQLGVRPLPCFHYGEDERYLEYYMANYEYITIGGMVPISTPQLFHWLDRIWGKYLCDGAGRPKIKVHGFGLTSTPLMERYPWYSVDSSSWVQIGAHGNIFMDGKTLAFSSQSPNAKVAGQHYDNLAPLMSQAVEKRIQDQGFEIDRLRDNTYARWAYNAWGYSELGKRLTTEDKRFLDRQPELFA